MTVRTPSTRATVCHGPVVGIESLGALLPWVATITLLLAAMRATAVWTRNIGIQEDWLMVAPWVGQEPNLLAWLWSQNNEHRLPVGRLIYLGLLRATDDFRSGMIASQLLLAALSMILAYAAARVQGGRLRPWHALFPLTLLHLGHWENLEWGWQIQFTSSTFLIGVLLAVVVRTPAPGLGGAIAAAAAMALLPMTGGNGIVIALGMVAWAVAAATLPRLAGAGSRAASGTLLMGAALAAATSGAYFIGYVHPWWSPPPTDWPQFVRAASAYFAMATGTWSRILDGPVSLFVLAVSAVGALLALRAAWRLRRTGDARALGLGLFICVNLALGVVIAVSRGAYPYQLPARYALFAAMPLLGSILAIAIYAPPITARVVPIAVALGFLLVWPANVQSGYTWRDWYDAGMRKVEADIAAQRPLSEIAERNTAFLLHDCNGCLLKAITQLRDAGIRPFAGLPN